MEARHDAPSAKSERKHREQFCKALKKKGPEEIPGLRRFG